jgi:hypothetical protein
MEVIMTGATDIRRVFPVESIQYILLAYAAGIKAAFAVAIAAAGVSFTVTLFYSWDRLGVKRDSRDSSTAH